MSRWGLDRFFALLAQARTREVLTAGALPVVLCAALPMEFAGLSMAMGTFLAGVMLSSSSSIEEAASDIRRRDAERLAEQVHGTPMSGLDRIHFPVIPEPLHAPASPES